LNLVPRIAELHGNGEIEARRTAADDRYPQALHSNLSGDASGCGRQMHLLPRGPFHAESIPHAQPSRNAGQPRTPRFSQSGTVGPQFFPQPEVSCDLG
jgi:hypothetical protein